MLFKKLKSNSGVTMIELVIVLAIMGILAVTVVPMFSQLQHKSQVSRNLSNMKIIQEAFLKAFNELDKEIVKQFDLYINTVLEEDSKWGSYSAIK